MAAGSKFAQILDDPDAPKAKVQPLSTMEGELSELAGVQQATKGKGVYARPLEGQKVARAAEEAAFWREEDQKLAMRRQREAQGIHAADEQMAKDEALRTQFGTTNPKTAALVAATGALDGDFAVRAAIEGPEWAKAAVERVEALTGKGTAQTLVERDFAVGKGARGEPYFTNLTREELHQERRDVEAITGEKRPPPVTDLTRIKPGRAGGAPSGTTEDPASILFQGALDKARSIAGKPEKQLKREQEKQRYFKEIWDKHDDIKGVRENLEDDFMSGALYKRGLTGKDVAFMEVTLRKRGKTIDELADPGVDRTHFKPWVTAGSRPGQGADKAEPATILNPGGSMPQDEAVRARSAATAADAQTAVTENLPRELPTMFRYATGKATPEPRATPGPSTTGAMTTGADILTQRRKKRKKSEEEKAEYEKGGVPVQWQRNLFGYE